MKAMVARLALMLSKFASGWSYDRWDPPYPGDGI